MNMMPKPIKTNQYAKGKLDETVITQVVFTFKNMLKSSSHLY